MFMCKMKKNSCAGRQQESENDKTRKNQNRKNSFFSIF